MRIRGLEGLTGDRLSFELQRGGRFVMYEYCISVIIMTFRRTSDVYFIRANENAVVRGLRFTVASLVGGWWGIPWGPVYTIATIATNLRGGRDVTEGVVDYLTETAAEAELLERGDVTR